MALYFYKGIYFYAVLYAAYTAVSLLGYRKWLRIMASQKPQTAAMTQS